MKAKVRMVALVEDDDDDDGDDDDDDDDDDDVMMIKVYSYWLQNFKTANGKQRNSSCFHSTIRSSDSLHSFILPSIHSSIHPHTHSSIDLCVCNHPSTPHPFIHPSVDLC